MLPSTSVRASDSGQRPPRREPHGSCRSRSRLEQWNATGASQRASRGRDRLSAVPVALALRADRRWCARPRGCRQRRGGNLVRWRSGRHRGRRRRGTAAPRQCNSFTRSSLGRASAADETAAVIAFLHRRFVCAHGGGLADVVASGRGVVRRPARCHAQHRSADRGLALRLSPSSARRFSLARAASRRPGDRDRLSAAPRVDRQLPRAEAREGDDAVRQSGRQVRTARRSVVSARKPTAGTASSNEEGSSRRSRAEVPLCAFIGSSAVATPWPPRRLGLETVSEPRLDSPAATWPPGRHSRSHNGGLGDW